MPVTPAEFWRGVAAGSPGASDRQLDSAERALCVALPTALREWLSFRDGAAGFVGPPPNDRYFCLLSVHEVVERHRDAVFMEGRPDLVLFGGDGDGEGFFFDPTRRGSPVLMIAYISNWEEDAIEVAQNVGEFFDRLHAGCALGD